MRVALSEGRLSRWQELLDELTYHDFEVLRAYYKIEPWGEERADLREAVMATSIARALSIGEVTEEQFNEQIESLRNYLGDGKEVKTFTSPNAAAATMKGFLGR